MHSALIWKAWYTSTHRLFSALHNNSSLLCCGSEKWTQIKPNFVNSTTAKAVWILDAMHKSIKTLYYNSRSGVLSPSLSTKHLLWFVKLRHMGRFCSGSFTALLFQIHSFNFHFFALLVVGGFFFHDTYLQIDYQSDENFSHPEGWVELSGMPSLACFWNVAR